MDRKKLVSQKKIDFLFGEIINAFLGVFKILRIKKIRNSTKKNINKIYILKLDAIGDSIISLPLIKAVKEKTNAHITILCSKSNRDVFLGQKFIDEIRDFNSEKFEIINLMINIIKLLKRRADFSIDLGQTSNLSGIISVFSAKYNIGFKKQKWSFRNIVYDQIYEIDYQQQMIDNFNQILDSFGDISKERKLIPIVYSKEDERYKNMIKKKSVGIHLFTNYDYKKIDSIKILKVIRYLLKIKEQVVLVFGPGERENAKRIYEQLLEKERKEIIFFDKEVSLKELAALMKQLKLFIANDSGPMHLANCMGTPVIGLFGHEEPVRYKPLGKKAIAIYKEGPETEQTQRIKNIEAEDIIKKIKEIHIK